VAENEKVKLLVDGVPVAARRGANLLATLAAAGRFLRADCGGRGSCGKCAVRAAAGALEPPEESERRLLGAARLAAGERLACLARIAGPAAVAVPAESRLEAEVVRKGLPGLLERLAAALPPAPESPPQYGVAVDLGTTTIAVYLCDAGRRAVLASTSARNPQAIYGDDVVSRIAAAAAGREALAQLQTLVVRAIDWAVAALCRRTGIAPAKVARACAVGNSTMIHLLLGADPSPIGFFPYAPRFATARRLAAGAIGLAFNPRAELATLPLISGYLGADVVAAALAADLEGRPSGTLLVDVGTNGEIIAMTPAGLAAASCATGPAFEGAAIRHGMQAASGAIDAVSFDPATGALAARVIRRGSGPAPPPAGICGSGIIAAVAELVRAGVITASGAFDRSRPHPFLQPGEGGVPEFVIVPADAACGRRAIVLTQKDVRAVQLAKSALRTGVELLCRENGLARPERILLAGAFGSFIDRAAALRIGLFPDIGEERIEVIGNAAGAGAVLALMAPGTFERAAALCARTRVLDLAAHPDFQSAFIANLAF
jgi:uncharacterized 2Fe-2S/4Fe-4S cluster protein (DUF4445 family)